MKKNGIQNLWEKGKAMEHTASKETFEQFFQHGVRRQSRTLKLLIWIYLITMVATLIMNGINIAGYWQNSTMLTVHGISSFLALGFLAYGFYLLREMRIIDRVDGDLITLIKRRMKFYRTKFEIWYVIVAVAVLLMIFALNTMVDNMDGHYRINKPDVFFGYSVFIFIFIYVVNKISHYPVVREMKAFLADLEAQVTEQTIQLKKYKKFWRFWGIVFFIIFTVLLLLGIWRALQP